MSPRIPCRIRGGGGGNQEVEESRWHGERVPRASTAVARKQESHGGLEAIARETASGNLSGTRTSPRLAGESSSGWAFAREPTSLPRAAAPLSAGAPHAIAGMAPLPSVDPPGPWPRIDQANSRSSAQLCWARPPRTRCTTGGPRRNAMRYHRDASPARRPSIPRPCLCGRWRVRCCGHSRAYIAACQQASPGDGHPISSPRQLHSHARVRSSRRHLQGTDGFHESQEAPSPEIKPQAREGFVMRTGRFLCMYGYLLPSSSRRGTLGVTPCDRSGGLDQEGAWFGLVALARERRERMRGPGVGGDGIVQTHDAESYPCEPGSGRCGYRARTPLPPP